VVHGDLLLLAMLIVGDEDPADHQAAVVADHGPRLEADRQRRAVELSASSLQRPESFI
jgi:hypothetical protein